MKNLLIIFCSALLLSSCYKEDPLVVAPEQPRIDLSDDPTNPVQHYIYTLYNDYGMILITDPQVVDYKFNFKFYNNIIITPPSQEHSVLVPAIDFVQENFMDAYPDDFKKKYFPFNLILAEKITDNNGEGDYSCFASTNFVAISNITDEIGSLTDEEKRELRGQINGAFLGALSSSRGLFEIPAEFNQITPQNQYGNMLWSEPEDNSPLYEKGFTAFDPEMTDPDWGMFVFPTDATADQKLWLEWICKTPVSERQSICSSYPKMQQKFDLLSGALETIGLDVDQLAPAGTTN